MRISYAKQLERDCPSTSVTGEYLGRNKKEVFIIENPSNNNLEILKCIGENEKKCLIDTNDIERTHSYFHRVYYKESKKTPIDFVEDSGGFDVNILEDHKEDFVFSIKMAKNSNYPGKEIIEWTTKKAE